ncbi:MAG TPA: hypothetical protein VGE88_09855 [Lysobacter sp.]
MVAFAFAIYLAAMVVGISSGLSMGYWQLYGGTMDEAVANARLVRRVLYFLVGAVLYWRFAAPIAQRRWLHVIALFVLVQMLDVVAMQFSRVHIESWFDPAAIARSLGAAAVGYALARAGSR